MSWDWFFGPRGPLGIRSLLDIAIIPVRIVSKKKLKNVLADHKLRLRKIISGGQFGADQGGLWAGRRLGLKTGGYAPKGWRTERGPRQELLQDRYGLVEDERERYDSRTRKNVSESDMTIIFGSCSSGGSRLTVNACQALGKPVYNFPHDGSDPREIGPLILSLTIQHRVRVLNVAGNRESISPGINQFVRDCLLSAFEEIIRSQRDE